MRLKAKQDGVMHLLNKSFFSLENDQLDIQVEENDILNSRRYCKTSKSVEITAAIRQPVLREIRQDRP